MIRLLITLLALMTGLAAESGPAQARLFAGEGTFAGEGAQVGSVEVVRPAGRVAVRAMSARYAVEAGPLPRWFDAAPAPAMSPQLTSRPGVLTRIDRARE